MNDPDFKFHITVTENKPLNIDQWNKLALQSGNIWQCTYCDEAQLFFNNYPWYFQCFTGENLIAGVKIYYYQSKKLPAIIRSISTMATQGSELLFDDTMHIDFGKLRFQLAEEIKKWLKNKHTTSFSAYSFFGEPEKLISYSSFKKIRESKIAIAKIDLKKSSDELWKEINPKHRSEIIKAKKNFVSVEFSNDLDLFFLLMDETYKNQDVHSPNKLFIRKEYEIFRAHNSAQLVFAKQNETYLCGALLYNFGKSSLYNYGGTIKNSIGAGQFLHWEIMKYLKEKEFDNYYLGETSTDKNASNRKFSEGITKFKLRFGAQQLPTHHLAFALNPFQLMIWNFLKKLLVKS